MITELAPTERLRLLNFVEGARIRSGGIGIGSVPGICETLAGRGHRIALVTAGNTVPGTEQFVCNKLGSLFDSMAPSGTFSILSRRALGRWAFAPQLMPLIARKMKHIDFVMLHSLYSFPVLLGYLLAKHYHKPYAVWPHGVLAPIQRTVSRRKKAIYNRLVARRILDQASVLFFTAEAERDEAKPLELKAPSVIVPLGINTASYRELPARGAFREQYLSGHRGPLVLYLGRLNYKKSIDLTIESFAAIAKKMPEARLALVGAGDPPEFADQIRSWLAKHGIADRTVMPGLLTGEAKLAAFADADVFVLSSHAENFGMAIFESLAAGVPVVISDTLNYAAEIHRHDAGLIVPRTADAFAEAMGQVLSQPELAQRLQENGRKLVAAYSWERTAERVEQTIYHLLRDQPLPISLTLHAVRR